MSSPEDIEAAENYFNLQEQREADSEIFKPMRENITIEDLKREQNYKGVDREGFDALAQELNITESLEELILMID